jgi:RHS repeat-associated protein
MHRLTPTTANETEDIKYTYDANNERISTVETIGTVMTEYEFYSKGQVALVWNSSSFKERYLNGPGTDQPLAVETNGAVSWFLADNLGTIRDVVNSSGVKVDHLVADAFGNIVSQTNSTYQPRFVCTGQEYDTLTGLYRFPERYYDPHQGRFISQDPSGFAGGDTNLYRYVGNDVTNATDPTGLNIVTPEESA